MKDDLRVFSVTIAGWHYSVQYDAKTGKIIATKCDGRWPWSENAIGDDWLEDQLRDLVVLDMQKYL